MRIRIGGKARSPTDSPVDVTNKWTSYSQDKVRSRDIVRIRDKVIPARIRESPSKRGSGIGWASR